MIRAFVITTMLPAILVGTLMVCCADGEQPDYLIETRAEFFERLNLDLPELAAVRAAVEAGDIDAAVAAYADFFRSRKMEHIALPDLGERNPEYRNRYADEAVELRITEYGSFQFDDPIDWRTPGMVTVCRFPHFPYLTRAYYHTRNPKYAEAIIRDIRSYLEAWPMTDAKPMGERWLVGGKIAGEANPWSGVIVNARTLRWLEALKWIRDYEGLSDGLIVDAITRIVEDLEWMLPQIARQKLESNITFADISYALYTAQILYEFDRSPQWLAQCRDMFGRWLAAYYYPDGGPKELTLAYGSSVVEQTNNVVRSLANDPHAEELIAVARRATIHMVGLVRPDLWLPAYGDLERRGNGCVTAAEQVYDLAWAEHIRTGGASGPAPPFTSWPPAGEPSWTGYYVMRSDWTPNALFLFVDGGVGGTSHRHADKLSIEVCAYGGNFIIDPGSGGPYHDTTDSVRINLQHGFQHNTITVDGVDQGFLERETSHPLDTVWQVNERYDLFEATYDFARHGLPVVHRRRIVFVKPYLWILSDTLEGEGEHRIERNFQCAADNQIEVGERRVVLTARNGATLTMFDADGTSQPEAVKGQREFPGSTLGAGQAAWTSWVDGGRGWSGRYFDRDFRPSPTSTAPAPALVYSDTIQLPATFTMVLVPGRPQQEAPTACTLSADRLEVSWPGGKKLMVELTGGIPERVVLF